MSNRHTASTASLASLASPASQSFGKMENSNQELVDLYETLRTKDEIFKRFNIAGTPPHHLDNPKFQKYFIGMALVCEKAFGKFPKSKEQILTYCKKIGRVDRRNWLQSVGGNGQ